MADIARLPTPLPYFTVLMHTGAAECYWGIRRATNALMALASVVADVQASERYDFDPDTVVHWTTVFEGSLPQRIVPGLTEGFFYEVLEGSASAASAAIDQEVLADLVGVLAAHHAAGWQDVGKPFYHVLARVTAAHQDYAAWVGRRTWEQVLDAVDHDDWTGPESGDYIIDDALTWRALRWECHGEAKCATIEALADLGLLDG